MKKLDKQSPLMKEIMLATLTKISEAGVEFSVKIPNNIGHEVRACTAKEVEVFLENPIKLFADHYGITESEYKRCVAEEYKVLCSGITIKGFACKNIVNGGNSVDPKTWMKMQGEYCQLHGDGYL